MVEKLFEKIDDNPGSYFGMLVESVEDKKELKEDRFVPKDKMSKKDRKELDSKKRNIWGNTNPVTRVQPNKKAYDRKRDKKELDEAYEHILSKENTEKVRDIMKSFQDLLDSFALQYMNKDFDIPYDVALQYYKEIKDLNNQLYNAFIHDNNYGE